MSLCRAQWKDEGWNGMDKQTHICNREYGHAKDCRCYCEPINFFSMGDDGSTTYVLRPGEGWKVVSG